MEKIIKFKKEIILGGVIICLCLLAGYLWYRLNNIVIEPCPTIEKEEVPITEEKPAIIMIAVDIKGQVKKPGVYYLEDGAVVFDAITKAGGLTPKADTNNISLSKRITDEMVIVVYSKAELNDYVTTKNKEQLLNDYCQNGTIVNNACLTNAVDKNENNSDKVSLNTATKEELMTLSGIGAVKALEIISYRETNNGFKTIEEIMNITGIGEATFAEIKDRLTI